jgi:hypothetical protein
VKTKPALILRRRVSAVSKDGRIGTGGIGAAWFETAACRGLLTMRVCSFAGKEVVRYVQ